MTSRQSPSLSPSRSGRAVRRSGADDAAEDVLNLPGSVKVSCLLMQDAVAAGVVSLAPGHGKVALFANPFLNGKEEALLVDGANNLSYLRRAATDTGWEQVSAAGTAIAAKEVVVVVHPRDLTLWAISTGDAGLTVLRLVGTTENGEVGCSWQVVPNAVNGNLSNGIDPLHHLYVSYNGRFPLIAGIKVKNGTIVTIRPFVEDSPFRFLYVDNGPGTPGGVGPVDDFVVAATGALPAGICYIRSGEVVTRYDLRDTSGSLTIAPNVTKLVGVYQTAQGDDVGCVFLQYAWGELVTWTPDWSGTRRGHYIPTSGLGLHTATTWTDANGMVHIYGLDADNTLKALHQASWDQYRGPVWSAAKLPLVPLEPPHKGTAQPLSEQHPQPRAAADSVPSCVPLVPAVSLFVVDPYPDNLPTQLVRREGVADPSSQFAIHTQDVTSTRWSRDKVRLSSRGLPNTVSHYVSDVTILDRRGTAIPNATVKVSAETFVEIQVDGASYLVGPGHSAHLTASSAGRVSIATHADGLLPAVLHVDVPGLEQGAVIQPASAVHAYLAGTGTLPSQSGRFTADALRGAKADGEPIVDPAHHASLDGVVASTKNLFELADTGSATSKLFRGAGPAPRIHGFAVGSAPGHARAGAAVTVGYTEFSSAADFDQHIEGIRTLPEYGGIWEDFTTWAGDVWEGIKNGVVEVYEVAVAAVTSFFVWIGDKIIELAGFVVDTVAGAVRAVEAVIREVVDTLGKVVDWLKALFAFRDIWDTKCALQAGVTILLDYGMATIEHLGDKSEEWFEAQEGEIHRIFTRLKGEYEGRPLGDAGNQAPALTDADGQGLATADLTGNPQATWMMNRTLGAPELRAGRAAVRFPADSPIPAAFQAFWAKVASTDVTPEVAKALGDLDVLLRRIIDPADPDGAEKSSMVEVLDIVEQLAVIMLKVAHAVVAAALVLLRVVAGHLDDVLNAPLELWPVDSLYKWIQTGNGVSEDEAESATLGGVMFLVAGFALTTLYKLVNGVDEAPFRGGFFPVIPAPPWHPAHAETQASDEESAAHNASMKSLQFGGAIIGVFAGLVELAGDLLPVAGEEGALPALDLLIGALSAVLSSVYSMIMAAPPVTGGAWTKSGGGVTGWTLGFGVTCATSLLSFGMLTAGSDDEPAGKQKTRILKNAENVTVGPVVVTCLSAMSLLFDVVGCIDDKINGYTTAAIVIADIPGLAQFARYGLSKETRTRAEVTALINVVAAEAGAIMVVASAGVPGPAIGNRLPSARVGTEYDEAVPAWGGDWPFNAPLQNWKVLTGADKLKAAGLTLDPDSGRLKGTPTAAGTVPFTVQCTDSYGPPQYSPARDLILTIR